MSWMMIAPSLSSSSSDFSCRQHSPSVSIDDVFDQLFSSQTSEPSSEVPSLEEPATRQLDGCKVSEGIVVFPPSSWVLLAASVIGNNLIVCRKCRKIGNVSYLLLQSSKSTRLPSSSREVKVPSFFGAHQILSLCMDTGIGLGTERRKCDAGKAIGVDPVFEVCHSSDYLGICCSSSVSQEFFLALFGPESSLLKAPVLVVGMQNGKVYFTNFIDGCMPSSGAGMDDSILSPLCDLEQPVVGLHWAYFPPRTSAAVDTDPLAVSWDMDREDSTQEEVADAPNALICVGQRGKVTVIYFDLTAAKQQQQQQWSEVEYQVSGPVVSSALLPGHCLLFTTVLGLYKVCLRSSCATCMEEKVPDLMGRSCSLILPHVSFSFPEKLQTMSSPRYIMKTRPPAGDSQSPPSLGNGNNSLQCSCVDLDGRIATLDLSTHGSRPDNAGSRSEQRQSAAQVGKEIGQCLNSIQLLSDRIAQTRRKIESLNSVLAEVKGNMELLCAVADVCGNRTCEVFRSCRPFKCSFTTVQEDAGLRVKSLFVRVGVTYSRPSARQDLPHRLSPGWSILVSASSLRLAGTHFSKFLALSGMASGESVSVTVAVDVEDLHLPVLVQCFVHYAPHLLPCRSSYRGAVSSEGFTKCSHQGCMLHLSSKVVSVLDFAERCTPASRGGLEDESLSSLEVKDVRRVLAGSDTSEQQRSLRGSSSYSTVLPISVAAAKRAILSSSNSAGEDSSRRIRDEAVGIRFLQVLRMSSSSVSGDQGLERDAIVTYSLLNGRQVTLEIENSGREVAGADHPEESNRAFHMAVKSRSKESVVEAIEAVHAILNCHTSTKSRQHKPGDEDDCLPLPPQLSRPEDLRDSLESLRGITRRVGAMREKLGSAHSQLQDKTLPLESYEKLVKEAKEKMFADFCKLRKLVHV